MRYNLLKKISIIIPVYNEENNILDVIIRLKSYLNNIQIEYEIIAVNDGSKDKSKVILEKINDIKTINHPYNKGYGAALKTGIENAKYNWVLFFDADGQHNPKYIGEMIKESDEYELITGDRSQSKYIRPLLRMPGLWLLKKIANYLVEYKIPDLNCGLRLIKKEVIKKYLHFMPNGFSMSTTSTLAFLKDKKSVKFIPIEVNRRNEQSKSMVKPKHAFTTLMLILRLIMLFSPLRIFLPTSIIILLIGLGFFIYDLTLINISETTIFILITAMLIFFFGLIADQISAIRREINK